MQKRQCKTSVSGSPRNPGKSPIFGGGKKSERRGVFTTSNFKKMYTNPGRGGNERNQNYGLETRKRPTGEKIKRERSLSFNQGWFSLHSVGHKKLKVGGGGGGTLGGVERWGTR